MTCYFLAACLLPLAVYCLILALANRRPRPFLVPGGWDFAGVLFAASGFLISGGAGILWGFMQMFATHVPETMSWLWVIPWGAYFTILVACSAVLVWWHRKHTAIYNIDAEVFNEALTHVLNGQNRAWERVDNAIFIDPSHAPAKRSEGISAELLPQPQNPYAVMRQDSLEAPAAQAPLVAAAASTRPFHKVLLLQVDVAPLLSHVTLRLGAG